MPEEAIKKKCRRCIERSIRILDAESYYVFQARGKAARVADIVCKDKGMDKLVKVCHESINRQALKEFLSFNDNQLEAHLLLEIHIWDDFRTSPQRFKLFYNQPKQSLPAGLEKLVK